MIQMLTELMSGLALFLFGMKFMSESLQKAAGDKMRGILNRVTKNKVTAVFFGAIFTAVIQSSGATTVMEVSFVNAGLMSLEQSVGITFGANIGTTITSQLVSLKLTAIAPYIIFVGACMMMFGKKPILRKVSEIIFGFGALFLGINSMTSALSAIPDYPAIMHFFEYLEYYPVALLIGLLFTVIVQSSSVTVSVLVLLADSGLVGLGSCLYFILGANVGSCMPALMAGMNSNRDGKRTALVHVMFNALGMIVIGVILIFAMDPVTNLIAAINGPDNAKRFVANADTIFKTFQCIIFLPISDHIVKATGWLVKDDTKTDKVADSKHLKYIGRAKNFLPSTAVVEIVQEIERMARMAKNNLIRSMRAVMDNDLHNEEKMEKCEEAIDYLSSEITDYLVEVNQYELPLSDASRIGALFHTVIDLERIGDHAMNILEDAQKKRKNNLEFTDKARKELSEMFDKVLELYDKCLVMFTTGDKNGIDEIIDLENEIDRMDIELQKRQVRRLSREECSVETGLIYTDLVIGLERIADHATNIAYSIFNDNPEDSLLE